MSKRNDMSHPIIITLTFALIVLITVWFAAIIVTFRSNDRTLQMDALLLPLSIVGGLTRVFLFIIAWIAAAISFVLMFISFFVEIVFYVIVYYNPVTQGNIIRDFAWNIRNMSIRREVEQHIDEAEKRAEEKIRQFKIKADIERKKAKHYEKQAKKLVKQEQELRYYIRAATEANSIKRVKEELDRYSESKVVSWNER